MALAGVVAVAAVAATENTKAAVGAQGVAAAAAPVGEVAVAAVGVEAAAAMVTVVEEEAAVGAAVGVVVGRFGPEPTSSSGQGVDGKNDDGDLAGGGGGKGPRERALTHLLRSRAMGRTTMGKCSSLRRESP